MDNDKINKGRCLDFNAATDIGRMKENNEDTFIAQYLWDDTTVLLAAIDGVGGYEGGEVAADIAQKEIRLYLEASSNGERIDLLKEAVTAANNAVFENRNTQYPKMSCVLSVVIIDTKLKQISLAHVGDTRVYQYCNGELKKLSHDHSPIGYREEIGDLTEEEAMNHPNRNLIQRDLGSEKHRVNDADFIEAQIFPLQPNSTLLLCSDGLTDMVRSSEIISVLRQVGTTIEHKVHALIDLANERGGKDNITVIICEYTETNENKQDSARNEEAPVVIKRETDSITELKMSDEDCHKDVLNGSAHLDKKNGFKTLINRVLFFVLGVLVGALIYHIASSFNIIWPAKQDVNKPVLEVKEDTSVIESSNYNKSICDSIDSLNQECDTLMD